MILKGVLSIIYEKAVSCLATVSNNIHGKWAVIQIEEIWVLVVGCFKRSEDGIDALK